MQFLDVSVEDIDAIVLGAAWIEVYELFFFKQKTAYEI
mgnify:CR=1 FL=1